MNPLAEFVAAVEGFEWDAGNSEKNWRRHRIRQVEAEQVLLNRPLLVTEDVKHSQQEARFFTLGTTDRGRGLAVVFTVRANLVRVISARPMSSRERRAYAKAQSRSEALP
jgi:uncharacterized DUF497 family protein